MIKFIIYLLIFQSCSSIYYKGWELLGKEKRDLLKSNMMDLRDDQEDAKDNFKDVLSKIRSSYSFKESKLSKTYDRVNEDYEELKSTVSGLISQSEKVKKIAYDLFREWESESKEYQDMSYKRESLKSLKKTKRTFNKVIASVETSENKMKKSLASYRDLVLYLKHNLNANIVGKLSIKLRSLETQIKEITQNISESIGLTEKFNHETF